MSTWRIRKERVYDRDLGRMGRHLGWSLYFHGRRIARYLTWQSCIDHICKVYAKWPEFGREVRSC